MLKKWTALLSAVVGTLVMASAAQATALAPGGSVVPDTSAETGTLVADTGFVAYSFAGVTKGEIRAAVYKQAGGTYDFVYQVTVISPPDDSDARRITGFDFKGWTTDVSQFATGPAGDGWRTGTELADDADRSAGGSTVGFNFSPAIAGSVAGTNSYVLIIRTSATKFGKGLVSVIDGATYTGPAFSPAPEPSSLLLLGGLAVGIGGRALRRRWKGQPVVG